MTESARQLKSPEIKSIEWGMMEVEGYPIGKDFKLFPGGAEEWNWSATGTRHVPGIQPDDVKELLEKGAEIIILSQGMRNKLETAKETKALLEEKKDQANIEYHIRTTLEAVELYNELAKAKKRVGALIHSTC